MTITPEQLAELEKAFDRLESAQNSHDPESHEPPDRTDEINADMEAVELLWEYRRELIAAARENAELRIQANALAKLTELHAVEGSMEAHIQQDPAAAQWVAKCFAAMLADAPNYVEMKCEMANKKPDSMDYITVTVKRATGKTPHEMRKAAEQDRDQWKERAEKAESSIQALVKAKGRYNTQLAYEKLALSASAPPGCDFPDPPIEP